MIGDIIAVVIFFGLMFYAVGYLYFVEMSEKNVKKVDKNEGGK